MAQTAEKLSDFYQHVCTYFSITQKEIENLSAEIKDDLVKYLGPLRRPFIPVQQFNNERPTEERDLIVKILGISPLLSYQSQKGKGYYQRLLGADTTGEIEFTSFQVNKFEVGQVLRISGLYFFSSDQGREHIRISRSGGIFPVPFSLDQHSVSQVVVTPDSIKIDDLPSNKVSMKAILLEKGEMEVRKEKFSNGQYSSLKIVVCAKKKKIPIYLQRQLAGDVSKSVDEHDVLLITNLSLKPSRGQIVAYGSGYSSFQNRPVDNYTSPDNLTPLYIPIQQTDLMTLQQNSFLIGKINGYLTGPIKFEGKFGDYYAAGFVDSSTSGSVTFNEDTIKKIPKSKDFLQQVIINGLVHSNKDYYKLDFERGTIKKDKSVFAPAIINGSEVMDMEGIFCIAGVLNEVFEPKEFTTKEGRTDTMLRVKFDCQGQYYNLTAFNQEDRAKLYELKLKNTYEIMFIRKDIYNDFVSLKMTKFTTFRLTEEGEDSDSTSGNNNENEYDTEPNPEDQEDFPVEQEDPDPLDEDF
ncbi:MAG: hypothetical protein HeimC3_20540 [Candidatus Heimdallarchaeota archaeon LC_3]|nr:MAG: hypothetical protein HeimC3_20540 [Candidatus Heimdallarchaeota archaeon LC_3]